MVESCFFDAEGLFLRLFAAVLCFCVAFAGIPLGEYADMIYAEKCEAVLKCCEGEDGVFEVVFEVSAGDGICALLGGIEYDAERLILLSAGADCGDAVFSHIDAIGEVRFLIDGVKNIEFASVNLFFACIEGADGIAELCISDVEALRMSGGQIAELDVELRNKKAEICCSDGDMADERIISALSSWRLESGEIRLTLSVSGLTGVGYFAAGVDLFVVRADGSGEKMLCVKVISPSVGEEIEIFVSAGASEPYAVIITPVAFNKEGGVRGEKTVVLN